MGGYLTMGMQVCVMALLVACSSVDPSPESPDRVVPLAISHHHQVELNPDRVDDILRRMQHLLIAKDSPQDRSCSVGFSLLEPIQAFHQGSGVINSEADFLDIQQLVPGNIKVVKRINYCGRWGKFLGCAPVRGGSLVVARQRLVDSESALWVHEYGHNMGLWHRTGRGLLMNPTVTRHTRQVNEHECQALARGY